MTARANRRRKARARKRTERWREKRFWSVLAAIDNYNRQNRQKILRRVEANIEAAFRRTKAVLFDGVAPAPADLSRPLTFETLQQDLTLLGEGFVPYHTPAPYRIIWQASAVSPPREALYLDDV